MQRLFQQHRVRKTVDMNGVWDFYFPSEGHEISLHAYADGQRECLSVPSCWENLDRYKTYRGQAVAVKRFELKEASRVRWVFKGVSHTAVVSIDGEIVGKHHNAYTPFEVVSEILNAGEHEICVHVSNEQGDGSALHVANDYYNYGGLTRPVELQILAEQAQIQRVLLTPKYSLEAGWTLDGKTTIKRFTTSNASGYQLKIVLKGLGQELSLTQELDLLEETNTTAWEMSCPNVKPWSIEQPHLYTVELQLFVKGDDGLELIDDLIDRMGFRTVSTEGEEILLNGERIFPMGFNRHEDHAVFGCAIPLEVMRQDLEQMRQMNANSVRTCHYPNDERFLDLCDEMGFLVWEENHARGLSIEQMRHPLFKQQCYDCNEEMVLEHYNHPSIYIWGILNECESGTEEGAEMYRLQFEQLRSLDQSRPLTFASCRHGGDLCQKMVDVASWNIYPRWYGDAAVLETVEENIKLRTPEGMESKPLIYSEFGAGAIPGVRDEWRRPKWSEDRQCDILKEQLEVILHHPRVSGAYIWQFCDVRVHEDWDFVRPRGYNNKGIVDEYRRPKLAFSTVAEQFAKKCKSLGS